MTSPFPEEKGVAAKEQIQMFLSEKFYIRKNKMIEVDSWYTSMNLLTNEYITEDKRISIVFKQEDYTSGTLDYKRANLYMSRKEALELGERLTAYGRRKLEGETACESNMTP